MEFDVQRNLQPALKSANQLLQVNDGCHGHAEGGIVRSLPETVKLSMHPRIRMLAESQYVLKLLMPY